MKVREAIKMIEENSHLAGLTDQVKAFLEKKTKKKVAVKSAEEKPAQVKGAEK